jgi:predicted dehydrogenase
MADVGFGIIGSGNMARVYADALATQVSGGRFVATAGGSRATTFAADYGAHPEKSIEALLARPDIDVAIIATPHSTHRPLAVAAADAGKHVYLEKPMALDITECDEIIDACRRAGVVLTIAKQTRHMQMAMKAKDLIDAGEIGELRYIRPMSPISGLGIAAGNHWSEKHGEGNGFLDWGSHCCDALRWLTGTDAVRVYADFDNFSGMPSLDPTAAVQIRMADGVIAQIFMCYEVPAPGIGTNSNNQYFIMGSTGMVEFDLDRVRLGRGEGWETVWELPTWINPLQPSNPRRIGNSARQVQDFIDSLREGRPPKITGADGRAAIEMTQAATLSAQTGRAVDLPLAV